jgi:hypothetical protein
LRAGSPARKGSVGGLPLQKYKAIIDSLAAGRHMDFYLVDDMFEHEGCVKSADPEIEVDVTYAVQHILADTGRTLIFDVSEKSVKAHRPDTGRSFEAEINRVYDKVDVLISDRMESRAEQGLNTYFQKNSDTLVWFDGAKWNIELNRNLFFNGERKQYDSAAALLSDNNKLSDETWQLIHYSSEADLSDLDDWRRF